MWLCPAVRLNYKLSACQKSVPVVAQNLGAVTGRVIVDRVGPRTKTFTLCFQFSSAVLRLSNDTWSSDRVAFVELPSTSISFLVNTWHSLANGLNPNFQILYFHSCFLASRHKGNPLRKPAWTGWTFEWKHCLLLKAATWFSSWITIISHRLGKSWAVFSHAKAPLTCFRPS